VANFAPRFTLVKSHSMIGSASGLSLPITPTNSSRPSMNSSINTGALISVWIYESRSISCLTLRTSERSSMPIDESVFVGLTNSGNFSSSDQSTCPASIVENFG
jgi:hypothetical protein